MIRGAMTPARVLAEEMPRLMAYNRRQDRLGSWVARDRETGDFLGWFMIRPVDQPVRTVELTYRLRRQAWQRGYDLEGILSMIDMARDAQMSKVIAKSSDVDATSDGLMERAGMRIVSMVANGTADPTSATAPSRVDYALDLTLDETADRSTGALIAS